MASCPVKFWYHHPKVAVASGVEFLETPNRKLYCRVARDGKYQPGAVVALGDEIEMGGQFKVSVLQYLPKARREVTCQPVEPAAGMARAAGPAAMVQVTAGETTRQLWLKESDFELRVAIFLHARRKARNQLRQREDSLGVRLETEGVPPRPEPGRNGGRILREHGAALRPQRTETRRRPTDLDERAPDTREVHLVPIRF